MKFNMVGREVEMQKDHIYAVLTAFILMIAGIFILEILCTLILPIPIDTTYPIEEVTQETIFFMKLGAVEKIITGILTPIYNLIFAAIIFVAATRIYKMKMETNICASLAAADFCIFLILAVLGLLTYVMAYGTGSVVSAILGIFGDIATFGYTSIQLGMWLIILMEWNRTKIMKLVPVALFFAIIMLIARHAIGFFVAYNSEVAYTFDILSLTTVIQTMIDLFFALPILYFASYIKAKDKMVYLFGGLYAMSTILDIIRVVLTSYVTADHILLMIIVALKLALLYLLAVNLESVLAWILAGKREQHA
ncbi:MAG: hypothetical protein ABII39_05235 [Candidatus Micrarchaeota archaeon]